MLLTYIFLPDTTGLDLREQERRWQYLRAGRGHEYHGVAIHPKHLSVWERICGVGKGYNPDLDLKQQIDDMRTEWEAQQEEKNQKEANGEEIHDDSEFTDEIHDYFRSQSPQYTGNGAKATNGGNQGVTVIEPGFNEKST